jgi:hypothetical protein
MNLALMAFDSPSSIVVVIFALIVVVGGLVFYALYFKGDVRAQFSHGSTMFKLEAKDRSRNRSHRQKRI